MISYDMNTLVLKTFMATKRKSFNKRFTILNDFLRTMNTLVLKTFIWQLRIKNLRF